MRALHNTTKNSTVRQSIRTSVRHGRRFVSLLLCFFMTMSMLCNFGVCALSSAAEVTGNVMNRIADGDTTDSYKGKLLSSEWGSRYAGRVWTDKSVFAFGNNIGLDMDTDGYDGTVNFNSDFGTIFSTLASSQVVKENPPQPLDLMLVLDVSGSMGKNGSELVNESNFTDSAISKTVGAINDAIDLLLKNNPNSRLGIVVYGSTAAVLVPLDHYTSVELSTKFKDIYGGTQGLHFSLTATVQQKDDGQIKYYADNAGQTNNEAHGRTEGLTGTGNRLHHGTGGNTTGDVTNENDPIHVGHITNPQAGLAAAMNEFIEGNSELTWNTIVEDKEYLRLPALIHLTDGQASDLAWIQPEAESSSSEAWKNTASNWNNVNWKYDLAYNSPLNTASTDKNYYNASQLTGYGDAAPVIFQTLMTAAYYKSAVEAYYNSTGVTDKDGKPVALSCYSIYASDEKNYSDLSDTQVKATIDAILGPEEHFKDSTGDQKDSGKLNANNSVDEYIDTAYELYKAWKNNGVTNIDFSENTTSNNSSFKNDKTNEITIMLNTTKEQLKNGSGRYSSYDWCNISVADIEKNINYVPKDNFSQTGFEGLDDLFQQVVLELLGQAFVPVSGNNASGVADSITYQDPLGEYMELKNGAITVEQAKDEKGNSIGGEVTGSTKKTFDMSMLLFGEMHGMVRAGVYDYQWNNNYMHNNHTKTGYPNPNADPDKDPLEIGWYKGDAENAIYSYDPNTGLPTGCSTAADAWANGWVLRLNYKTLAEFVPISGITDTMLPTEVPEQIQHTVYTCYRFADSQKDRNALRRNPIFGAVPEDLLEKWKPYETEGNPSYGKYPKDNKMYSNAPGVYRLSDIRVWTEHTGDFVDQTGAITPEEESGYDDSLYVNVPVSAVPTQLAEITLGAKGPISYKDNLNDKKQSTPLRLFYAVGLTEDLIQRDADGNQTGVDVSKISGEYIESHSDPETNNIYFISNWYSNTPHRGYTSDAAEEYRTRGDAAVTFSPNEKNRYYLFQKPLPLFAHAWRVKNESGDVEPVDRSAGENWGVNKSGNGKTTWENSENPGTWSGGEFIGTYDNEDSFKSALNAATSESGIRYIKDNKGYTYSLPGDITDAIITFTNDQMKKVTSQGDGYTEDSISFSSDDYFFLCVEYYLPMDGVGVDINGNPVNGTHTVRKVTRLIARKGSEFGSGLHSENINNGDMLCWSDINGNCSIEIEYNSRTDTGDNTRGEPTFEKLTLTGNDLKDYLRKCGLKEEGTVTWTENGKEVQGTPLDRDVAYWESVQKDPHMAALIEEIKKAPNPQQMFNELFDWSVSAKTGGIRVGDMYQNIQPKGNDLDLSTGYYPGNVTKTANNYYIPTLSETSTAGAGLVIDNYLGNNGRLEIANSTLMVTKTLVAPDGFTMTNAQQNETFDYQVYIAGVSGLRSAQRLKWNPFSQSWQKRVESLDILTDNSSLVLDTNGNRALFCYADGIPRQVVEVFEDGKTNYYYADENGAATDTECAEAPEGLYYMYLPSEDNLTYRLFASSYEDGTTEIEGVGTTAYCPKGTDVGKLEGDNDNQKFAVENGERPAGSRDYWTSSAKLIPYSEVQAAEATDEILSGESGIAVMALEAESNRQWDYNKSDQTGHKDPGNFTLVTVIPDPTGTDSTVYSPFNSRTQYMSTELYFGYNKRLAEHLKEDCTDSGSFAGCTHLEDYKLGGGDLYDQIVPTADRPDLFTGLTNDTIAKNTAEFTLKNGEGLLFTGLGNRIPYRFTEKLTDEQMQKGYILKEISHVQQRGSDTVYMPGVQNVPVYKNGDGTVTWAIGQGGTAERTDITPQSEPFAHTNATIWESYATMAPGSLGNHHQPEASAGGVPAKNPSCNDAKTEAELDVGKCDLAQPDGSTRHYFYYGGKLVDPHYEGEMPGMSRYVLNPTAHFGVVNETVTSDPATNPESGYYDYTGVYSVYGDTGYFSEQAHYINTVSPEMLVLTKQLVDESGNIIDSPPDQEFEFTINLFESDKAAIKDNDNKLYIWRGNKNMLGKSPEEGGPPSLDKYQDYIPVDSADPTKTYLTELTPDETETIITYTVKLRANETVVIYGLAAGTNYSVEETPNKDYPVVGGDKHTDSGVYMQFGKIAHNSIDYVAMKPSETKNRTDFYNQVSTGSLTVEKYIMDDDRETVTNEFEFTVTLTPPSGTELKSEDLSAVKYGKDDAEVPDFTLKWENVTDAEGKVTGLTATFKLKHGEKVVINGIPLNTTYNVAETQKDGYNLQHVADNHEDKPDTKGEYLNLTNNSVNGNITAENSQAYLFFANGRAPYLPFAGGFGWMLWSILGTVLLLLPPIIYLVYKKRRSYP